MNADDAEFERLLGAAGVAYNEGRPREAAPLARAAMAIVEKRSGTAPGGWLVRAATALAEVCIELAEFDEAEALSRRALRALDDTSAPDDAATTRLRVRVLCTLGSALRGQGLYRAAEELLDDALTLAESSLGSDDRTVVRAANDLAVLYKYTARFDDAERLYRRALGIVEAGRGSDDLEAATLWHNLGGLDHSRGRHAAAEPAARRAVEIRRRALGSEHPAVAADEAALAAILDALGRADEAEALFCRALDTFTRLLGPRHYEVAVQANNLGALRYRCGDYEQAQALWEQALDIKCDLLGETHPELAATIVNLGVLAATVGEHDRARRLLEHALELLDHADVGSDHPSRRAATASLARLSDSERQKP